MTRHAAHSRATQQKRHRQESGSTHLQIHVVIDGDEVTCVTGEGVGGASSYYTAAKTTTQEEKSQAALPLYSVPHLSLMMATLPVRLCRKGLGVPPTPAATNNKKKTVHEYAPHCQTVKVCPTGQTNIQHDPHTTTITSATHACARRQREPRPTPPNHSLDTATITTTQKLTWD